ncbi:MAG: GNAT family N-acetyltransferase [Actinomycetota bacterium]|nr:GNAT family N-acetyltransferase [Actinomycetota bacterium]MDQ3647279.1 GNAT family N-acetyltransferase [Actinomycetota bacterium]
MANTTAETGIEIRHPASQDAEECGRICFEAFRSIAERHSFPPDFPSPEMAAGVMSMLIAHPGIYGVVAERDGRVVGSNFLDERSTIAGVGPITVDPGVADAGIGRRLMAEVLERAAKRDFRGVRLLQSAYHTRSFSLYAKLGFAVREVLATMQGDPIGESVPGHVVRPAQEGDVEECNHLCAATHGHDRAGELRDAVAQGAAQVVQREGAIVGYTTGIAFFGHSIAQTDEALKALIGAAPEFGGPGFLLPARNVEVFGWCSERGLRVVHLMTLMTRGDYQEPTGPFMPSILY